MKALGPWVKEAPPPPGTRVWARYSEHDKGYTGTVLGVQPPVPRRRRRHCRSCTCEFPPEEEYETLDGEDLPGGEGWIRVEVDPGELTLSPGAKGTTDRGPRGELILLCPAEGLTPLAARTEK